ncbi:uncharacterized protein TRIVIDRAFT_203655 [Trichoderma virens Gv29-8]|uniref:Uncharacterized protein n=1 Tax=Hypocrea virens (strain Gv29-8 / FGSC 10586) TaxID=413071 RepID=G9N1A8_HYPVG|nr:uncharacterized protein TRIVIDRAFT_203655 [Trichoderma virens Gv29-8]EHK19539.1 hypothetical protein TRIVIDRAFT_203655 [Trichoderma virens Gv29-8]UKZ58203.1 hypothetical protein TrVGV298_012070 [Trichoderma virens]
MTALVAFSMARSGLVSTPKVVYCKKSVGGYKEHQVYKADVASAGAQVCLPGFQSSHVLLQMQSPNKFSTRIYQFGLMVADPSGYSPSSEEALPRLKNPNLLLALGPRIPLHANRRLLREVGATADLSKYHVITLVHIQTAIWDSDGFTPAVPQGRKQKGT